MPAEPCFSPVVWTFRWGRGCRVLGPSLSLGSLYSLWSSGLQWNHAPFRNKARVSGSTLLLGEQNEAPSHLLSDPTVGIPGCTGVQHIFITESGVVFQSFAPWSLMMGYFGIEGNMGSNSLRPRTALIQLSLSKGSHYLLLITKALTVVAATSCFQWCLICSMRSLTQNRARRPADSQHLSRGICQITVKSLKWGMGGFRGLPRVALWAQESFLSELL